MNTCKNCGKEYEKNNIYCSYKCRNIYVNKNLRDYNKNIGDKVIKNKNDYYDNPKRCKECDKILPYNKKVNTFCNNSCKAKNTNQTRKGIKYNMSEQGLENLRKSAINLHGKKYSNERKKYIQKPNKFCLNCGKEFEWLKRNNKYCNTKCRGEYERSNMDDYQKYYNDCKFQFSLKDYPNEFNFGLIEEHGWYSASNRGDNLYGVSRDHIYSVKQGYEDGISPEIIAHPANCKLMLHSDNVSKHKRSDITLSELKQKINKWNKKYEIK